MIVSGGVNKMGESLMPLVFNRKNDLTFGATYVGRPTKWGNPFKIGRDGTREDVCASYEVWVKKQIASGLLDIGELRGKNLACWCAPLPCHADILVRLANLVEDKE